MYDYDCSRYVFTNLLHGAWTHARLLPDADPPLLALRADHWVLYWRLNPSFPFQQTYPGPSAMSGKEIIVLHNSAEEISLTRSKLKEQTRVLQVFEAQIKMHFGCSIYTLFFFTKMTASNCIKFPAAIFHFWCQDCDYGAEVLFSHCTTRSFSCPAGRWTKTSAS